MKKRVFSTNTHDRIQFTTGEATSSRSNVSLSMLVRSGLDLEPVEVSLTPREVTRFMELIQDVDAAVWADEMGDCREHELTGVRCEKCGGYCGTVKRCPHCAPRAK